MIFDQDCNFRSSGPYLREGVDPAGDVRRLPFRDPVDGLLTVQADRLVCKSRKEMTTQLDPSQGNMFLLKNLRVQIQQLLTHDGDRDRPGDLVPLHVGGLAGVRAGPRASHGLQHQTLLGDQDAVLLVVDHLLALLAAEGKKKKSFLRVLWEINCRSSVFFPNFEKNVTNSQWVD